jgi:glycosyltransferase involved in cell wall biosynthesis
MPPAAFRPCAIVPVFNHEHAVGSVIEGLLGNGLNVITVDDGSDARCAAVLKQIEREHPEVSLVRHPVNRGKGKAVMTGLRVASEHGYTHALQIDADGQHAIEDVPRFLQSARQFPDSAICGRPVFDGDMPRVRFYGRYLSHGMVWLETLSLAIPDSMCGLRLYPLPPMLQLIDAKRLGARMDFDIEVLVRLNWRNVPMRWVDTRVVYPSDGVSHYRYLFDNLFVVGLHIRLFFGMLWRLPYLLWRNVTLREPAIRT